MSTSRLMRIGELAERSARTVRTLHFYEELGLLSPAMRTKGGFREYDDTALFRIEWIGRLQDLGFSLPDIKVFLGSLHAQPTGPEMMAELRAFYDAKLAETRTAVARLQALEADLTTSLEYLSTCRSCMPATAKSACSSCADGEHAGSRAPNLVAAIHTNHEARP